MKTIPPISCKTLSINTLIVVLSLVIYSIGAGATVRYVKPIATGLADGSSWDNASPGIQMMINESADGDSVWVAAGVYKPNSYPTNCIGCYSVKHYTFFVKAGVQLFGNFNGTETDISQRDFGSNTTFLSGDLNDNDVVSGSYFDLTITGNAENVNYVVLVCDTTTVINKVKLDGFTIKGGNAIGPSYITVNDLIVPLTHGGGICLKNQQTVITNCFIVNNSSSFGGGIYSFASHTEVNNCIISSNVSYNTGGGINLNNILCKITNNSLIGNKSHSEGGGIYSNADNIEIGNNKIIGNIAGNNGAGISMMTGLNTIYQNVITNNYTSMNGGAIYQNTNTTTISMNVIAHNTAGMSGGGLHLTAFSKTIVNNVIYDNHADEYGGGIYVGISVSYINNNTIVGNTAEVRGGGLYVHDGANNIRNNIFWGNWLDTLQNVASTDLYLKMGTNTFYSNMLQLDSSLYTGANFSLGATAQLNKYAQNPLFLSDSIPEGADLFYLTGDDGLRLQTNSPALNTGTTYTAPETDILGITRDSQPDIGAYEHGVVVGIQPNIDSSPKIVLNAYPNPATDAITFTFTTPITDISTLLLYAIDGQNITTLYKGTTQAGQTNTLTIDTKAFTPGIYCAVLRCGNGLAQHRTIIIK